MVTCPPVPEFGGLVSFAYLAPGSQFIAGVYVPYGWTRAYFRIREAGVADVLWAVRHIWRAYPGTDDAGFLAQQDIALDPGTTHVGNTDDYVWDPGFQALVRWLEIRAWPLAGAPAEMKTAEIYMEVYAYDGECVGPIAIPSKLATIVG